MVDFGRLKKALKGIINRKDLTDDLAGDFINRAISEIQRPLRLPSMEALLVADAWDGTGNSIMIPSDYLELSDIFTDSHVLRRVSLEEFLRFRREGTPEVYVNAGPNWLVRPSPQEGDRVYVQYYREAGWLKADSDVNQWTKAAFDLVLYAAASLAADYFQMEDGYVQRFQGKADALLQALQAQAYDDKWSGTATMGAPHGVGEY